MSRIDSWLMIYGKNIFASFFDNTNLEILMRGRNPFKDIAKALQFQGQDELWITVGRKYMQAVEFGKTGMGRDIFKEIFSA